jgi:predicted RNA-binding Zn-ribbon protein involved in translation (DUF1610 family)
MKSINPNIKILSDNYSGVHEIIKIQCLKSDCNHIWSKSAHELMGGVGCPSCSGHTVSDKNRLSIINPHVVKYFKDKDIAETHSYSSNIKAQMVCPDCGFERKMRISEINSQGFKCSKCGDGTSVSERFLKNILMKLNVDFTQQYNIENRRYDFYISSLKCIIELNGRQHYEKVDYFHHCNFEKQKEIDDNKEKLAMKNIPNCRYIKIKTDKTDFNYIYNNILNSGLKYILNFNDINKEKIFKNSQYLKSKLIIDLYNEYKDTNIVSSITKYPLSYVCKILREGKNNGLCEYKRKYSSKMVIFDNIVFESIKDFMNYNNISSYTHIGEQLAGNRPMPQKWIDRGLRYYNPETDKDLPIYQPNDERKEEKQDEYF